MKLIHQSLINYELLKLGKKRLMLGIVALLLLISCAFYTYEEWKAQPELIADLNDYEKIASEFHHLPIEDGAKQVDQRVEELSVYSMLADESYADVDPYWAEHLEEIKNENKELVEKFYRGPYAEDHEKLNKDLFFYSEIKKQYEAIDNHQHYIAEMTTKADDLLAISIFHDENTFTYRNIQKTVKDFEPVDNYQLGLEYGLASLVTFKTVDLFILLLIFIIVYYLFQHERDIGFNQLIQTTKKGKTRTVIVKLGTMVITIISLVILFYGPLFAIANQLYGFGDLERSIQSMAPFKNASINLSVSQFIILFLTLKTCAFLVLGSFIALLFTLFHRASGAFLILLASLASSYLLYILIHPGSYANSLKYLNLVALLDTYQVLADYRNINVLGYPFSKVLLSIVLGVLLFTIFFTLVCIASVNQWSLSIPFLKTIQKGILRIRTWMFNKRKFNALFQHEWYKLVISSKGWVTLIIGIIITVQLLQPGTVSYTLDQSSYNYYMQQLSGELDEEKITFIQSEMQRFDEFRFEQQDVEAAYQSGELSEEDYFNKRMEWHTLERREKAFDYVTEQYNYLLYMKDQKHVDVGFVNKISTDYLFDSQVRDTVLVLLFLVLIGSLLSSLFTNDYRNQAAQLMQVTANGRGPLFRVKISIAYILVCALFIMLQSPKYIILFDKYAPIDWNLSIQSIQMYRDLPWMMTIKQYVWLTQIIHLLGCLIMVHVIHGLSILVRRQSLSLLLQTLIFIIPLVIFYFGFHDTLLFTFNGMFLATHSFKFANATFVAWIYIGCLVLLSIGALFFSWKWFNKTYTGKE